MSPFGPFLGGATRQSPSKEQVLVDALKACGGNMKVTVMPDYDNDNEMPAYTEPALYAWLLAQSLK